MTFRIPRCVLSQLTSREDPTQPNKVLVGLTIHAWCRPETVGLDVLKDLLAEGRTALFDVELKLQDSFEKPLLRFGRVWEVGGDDEQVYLAPFGDDTQVHELPKETPVGKATTVKREDIEGPLPAALIVETGSKYGEEDLFPEGVPRTLLQYDRKITRNALYVVTCRWCKGTYEKFVHDLPRDNTEWLMDFFKDHRGCLPIKTALGTFKAGTEFPSVKEVLEANSMKTPHERFNENLTEAMGGKIGNMDIVKASINRARERLEHCSVERVIDTRHPATVNGELVARIAEALTSTIGAVEALYEEMKK